MSNESIVDARSLRQFLAREAIEKETSIEQSPDKKAGSKIKTPTGDQKKMHKGRRGNSQRNDQKNYKNRKSQINKNKLVLKRTKMTMWRKENCAANRKRKTL